MKTAPPIDWSFRVKIVPFHADAEPVKIAIQLPPAMGDMSPRVPLGH
jgi:hypothetical protein